MASIRHQYILVGIETDPTRYHGENASQPALLDQAAAEQVLAYIAADLAAVISGVKQCRICMAGALFDQTQLLRPQLPVYGALETLHQTDNSRGEFQPGLLSIGAINGQMPLQELQPLENIPAALLQLLPLLISGPGELVNGLSGKFKNHFPKAGKLPAQTARSLESQFQVSVNQARFMTIDDLHELLRLQLEHFGFRPLWELLDTAMASSAEAMEVSTQSGLRFKWRERAVHSFFETFDWWAQYGSGVDIPASGQQLQSAYAGWTGEYRRYLTTLNAYGIKVCQHLPGQEDTELSDSFLVEESTLKPEGSAAPLTEHTIDNLGIVAVTVVSGERQMNFYPLQASGLDDLHRFIREQGYHGDVAFPGGIHYAENSRQLLADTL